MPLNILLADDSVPAQNMGKKILMDAGYGVVTVSNGVEALRKIAEAVPDMAILDIFMPGYTGLEICKRLRSSAETATVPVILTVGKLEPYRPEDGEQVQSNAVIVKPFAANELISAVRSLIGGPLAETQTSPGLGLEAKSQPGSAEDPFTVDHPATPEPDDAAPEVGGYSELFYSGEFLLSDADPNGAASLAFDPDATHTPFSASAIETLSPASSPAPAENGTSAFGKFDLERESSAPAVEPETSMVEEPSLRGSPAHEAGLVEDNGLDAFGSGIAVPQSLAAPEAIASASLATAELESPGLEVPASDPLPEMTPDAAAEEVDSTSDAVQLSPEEEARIAAFEALFNSPEPLPLDNVAVPQAAAAAVAMSSILDTPNLDAPNEAPNEDAPSETAYEIEPEPEIMGLADDRQEHFAAHSATHCATDFANQALDPNPLDPAQHPLEEPESEPLSTIEAIPDPLPEMLLDKALAPAEWPETGSAWNPEELIASASIGIDLPQLEPGVRQQVSQQIADEGHPPASVVTASALDEAAPLEAAPVAAQQVCAEVYPESPSAYEPAHSAEILQAAPGLAQEASQARPEIVPLDATPLEAVLAEAVLPEAQPPAPELLCSELDSPLDDAGPAQVEAAPVQAAEEPLEPAQLYPEQQPDPIAEISSPPGLSSRLNEAERIHHAIELVFDRFKPLLVAAIVRELARHD